MFQIIRSAFRLLVFPIVLSALVGLVGFQQPSLAQGNPALVQRLNSLRSTSPENGVRYDMEASTYNVAVADEMIKNLQTMSEHGAMAMQSSNEDLKAMGAKWHQDSEDALEQVRAKRSELFSDQIRALSSTSPEQGVR